METLAECAKRVATKPSFADTPPLECLMNIITILINYAFIFLGAVAIIFLLIGAIKFITAGGDPKAVKSARDTMTFAAIGTILVLSVYIIAHAFANAIVPYGSSNFFDFKLPITP